MSEAGVAFVQLVPSMRGFSADVSRELGRALSRPAKQAGDEAGSTLAKGITSGVDDSKGKFSAAAGRVGDLFKTGLQAAGLAAGALLATGLIAGMEQEAATDKLVAQLGGGQFAAEMGEIAGNLYRDAFGDSIADTGEALRQVLASPLVSEDDTNAVIEAMTARVLTFTDVMDQDLQGSIRAVSGLLRTGLASDAEGAFDLLTRGIQQGGDIAGDLLETFTEYPVQFQALGLSGADAMGLVIQGLKGGARDADVVADALKELAIRGKDASATSAEGFRLIGLNAEEMTAKFAAGGPQAREAVGQVLEALAGMEDQTARNAAATALFGTKSEDLQAALGNLDLDTAAMMLGETAGATDALGSAYDNASTRLESFKRKALDKLVTIVGGSVIPGLERLAEVLGPPIQGGLRAAGDLIGEFWNAFSTGFTEDEGTPIENIALRLRDFVGFLRDEAWPVMQDVIARMTDAWKEHGPAVIDIITQVASIIGSAIELIVAIIRRAVQVIMFIWTNWGEEIMAVVTVVWELLSGIISGALDVIQGIIRTVTAIINGDWSEAWEGIKQTLSGVWEILESIVEVGLDAIVALIDLGLAVAAELFSAAWDAIKDVISLAWTSIKLIVETQFGVLADIVSGAWDTIKGLFTAALDSVSDTVSSGFDDIMSFFTAFPGRVRRGFSSLARIIKAPFTSAFNAIKRAWNNTIGGFRLSIPGVFGFGGVNFTIPRMHTGGIFNPVGGGREGLALLERGEGVFRPDQMAALGAAVAAPTGPAELLLSVDGETMFIRWIQHLVRVRGGGDVQVAFGGGR